MSGTGKETERRTFSMIDEGGMVKNEGFHPQRLLRDQNFAVAHASN